MFDLIVLGAGPAGYMAAERASAGGMKVCLIEKRNLGGVCLIEGCIPTKALLHSAKILDCAVHGSDYGVHTAEARLDHGAVLKRKNKVVKTLVAGVSARMRAHGVEVVSSEGVIAGRVESGFSVLAGERECSSAKLLIATGSEAVLPSIPGAKEAMESGFAMTSREILDIPDIPASLVVIGAGAVGLELASYFSLAGSKVTVVELLDKIAGPMESEISGILMKSLEKKGVNFRLCARVAGLTAEGVEVATPSGSETLPAERVLLCVGRRPSVTGLGLENIGVYTEKGAVVTDHNMCTNVPGVYAAGDVNGKSMLAHTAYREAEVAVNHMLGRPDCMNYSAIPSVIYTSPEAAGVGETEESARTAGIPVKVAKIPMRYSGRYLAENEGGNGICKLIVHEKENRLLGAHLVGGCASEIILAAAMMIELRQPVERLRELVFPHPTVGEVIREALFALE